jgi:hypothetical protein
MITPGPHHHNIMMMIYYYQNSTGGGGPRRHAREVERYARSGGDHDDVVVAAMAMAIVMAVDNRGHDFVRWNDVPHDARHRDNGPSPAPRSAAAAEHGIERLAPWC